MTLGVSDMHYKVYQRNYIWGSESCCINVFKNRFYYIYVEDDENHNYYLHFIVAHHVGNVLPRRWDKFYRGSIRYGKKTRLFSLSKEDIRSIRYYFPSDLLLKALSVPILHMYDHNSRVSSQKYLRLLPDIVKARYLYNQNLSKLEGK